MVFSQFKTINLKYINYLLTSALILFIFIIIRTADIIIIYENRLKIFFSSDQFFKLSEILMVLNSVVVRHYLSGGGTG